MDELEHTSDDEPDKLISKDKDGNETVELLPPRMDATLAVNAALLAQPNEGG